MTVLKHLLHYKYGWLLWVATLHIGCIAHAQRYSGQDTVKGLKDYYKDYFPIGVAVTPAALKTDEARLIRQQFNSLTPENAMKMERIHPRQDQYNWKNADEIVDFARANGMKVRGHTLLWHNQVPDWIFKDDAGETVSRDTLLERLKSHIMTVVGRYKGVVYAWDVANEVISDKPEEFYRPSLWLKIGGEEIVAKAFQWAHEADPDALLFYNDYNEIDPGKRKKIITLLDGLIRKGIPVHGVGLQAHWAIDQPSFSQLENTLADFAALGLKMQITELDISVYPKTHAMRQQLSSDTDTAFTRVKEELQLEQYKRCFALFRKYKSAISSVTCWNISDRHSWLDNFPVKGRKDYPLLFDAQLAPKKAYRAVVQF